MATDPDALKAAILALCASLRRDDRHRDAALAVERALASQGRSGASVADESALSGVEMLDSLSAQIAGAVLCAPADVQAWQRDLLEISRRPAGEWRAVLASLKRSQWVRENKHRVTPLHVVKYWARYAAGDVQERIPEDSQAEQERQRERFQLREQLAQARQAQADGVPVGAEIARLLARLGGE